MTNQISNYVQNYLLSAIPAYQKRTHHTTSGIDFRDLFMQKIRQTSGLNHTYQKPKNLFLTGSNGPTLANMDKVIGLQHGAPTSGLGNQQPTVEINQLVRQAAAKYDVDDQLIHAMIKVESNYNPHAKSRSGAVGLMQLMPETAFEIGVTNRFNSAQSIDGGTHYFSNLLTKHDGNLQLALAAYNAGPGNVQKYGGIPPFKETHNYIKKVMDHYLQ